MTEDKFKAALDAIGDDVDEDTDKVAGEAVRVTRDVDSEFDADADVISGTETLTVTRLASGVTYKNVGRIISSYGRWAETDFSGWVES